MAASLDDVERELNEATRRAWTLVHSTDGPVTQGQGKKVLAFLCDGVVTREVLLEREVARLRRRHGVADVDRLVVGVLAVRRLRGERATYVFAEELQPGGSTNLEAGLRLGCPQVDQVEPMRRRLLVAQDDEDLSGAIDDRRGGVVALFLARRERRFGRVSAAASR